MYYNSFLKKHKFIFFRELTHTTIIVINHERCAFSENIFSTPKLWVIFTRTPFTNKENDTGGELKKTHSLLGLDNLYDLVRLSLIFLKGDPFNRVTSQFYKVLPPPNVFMLRL